MTESTEQTKTQIFNTRSRTDNVLMSSSIGTIAYVLSSVMGFVYRTVFIKILSADYLGINGLFWNVLTVLSLTELGFGAAITYRFYKPIAENDVRKVGELMGFFKEVYSLVACIILLAGLALFPFLDHLINDPESVPADVNLGLVYLLFLLQSVISYVCVYRMSMWTADQKQYVCSVCFGIADALRFVAQIVTLLITGDFMLTVAVSIVVTLVSNVLLSCWATHHYKPVFQVKSKLPRAERWQIVKDALALMCHRIGNVVVVATDSIVLARFVSIGVTGLFSNYTLLYKTLYVVFGQAFGQFTASFGNAYAKLPTDEYHAVFRRMQFVTLAASGLASACFYFLVDDFIVLWIGEDMLLSPTTHMTAILLGVQFYIGVSQSNVNSNLGATGLFVRDRIRPLIEAAINLGTSIPLALRYGAAGVVAGSVISISLTSFWRAPYILYSGAMKRSVWHYWSQFGWHSLFTLATVVLATFVWRACAGGAMTWFLWLVKASVFSLFYIACLFLVFWRTDENRYFISRVKRMVEARLKRSSHAI